MPAGHSKTRVCTMLDSSGADAIVTEMFLPSAEPNEPLRDSTLSCEIRLAVVATGVAAASLELGGGAKAAGRH